MRALEHPPPGDGPVWAPGRIKQPGATIGERVLIEASLIPRIAREVDKRFEDQIQTTLRLAASPSTRGAEGPAQDPIAELLRKRAYSVDDWKTEIDAIRGLPDFGQPEHDFSQARTVVGTMRPEVDAVARLQSRLCFAPRAPTGRRFNDICVGVVGFGCRCGVSRHMWRSQERAPMPVHPLPCSLPL